jgi:quercetin dioxygenase-like cupin family protein
MVSDPLTPAQPSHDAFAGRLRRTEVQRSSSSIPGREIVQVLTEIPVGVESGWHTHPGEEVGYIVAGTVEMMTEGQPSRTLHAGDGFLMRPEQRHNARDVGPAPGRCCPRTSSRSASRWSRSRREPQPAGSRSTLLTSR